MYYIKSTSSKEYIFNGKRVPGSSSGRYLELNSNEYNKLMENKVIKSLVSHNDVIVLDKMPNSLKDNPDTVKQNLQVVLGKNAELENKLAESEKKFSDLQKEALDELSAKDKEIEKLKKALEKASKKSDKEE